MDTFYILVFMLVNLLPASKTECKVFVKESKEPILQLKKNAQDIWEAHMIDNDKVRKFQVSRQEIKELDAETGNLIDLEINKDLDIKGINWKKARTIFKISPTIQKYQIKREKGTLKIKVDIENLPELTVAY